MLKLPKELELPRMKDHQMFRRVRIVQLQEELQDKFKALKVGEPFPPRGGVRLYLSRVCRPPVRRNGETLRIAVCRGYQRGNLRKYLACQ